MEHSNFTIDKENEVIEFDIWYNVENEHVTDGLYENVLVIITYMALSTDIDSNITNISEKYTEQDIINLLKNIL